MTEMTVGCPVVCIVDSLSHIITLITIPVHFSFPIRRVVREVLVPPPCWTFFTRMNKPRKQRSALLKSSIKCAMPSKTRDTLRFLNLPVPKSWIWTINSSWYPINIQELDGRSWLVSTMLDITPESWYVVGRRSLRVFCFHCSRSSSYMIFFTLHNIRLDATMMSVTW